METDVSDLVGLRVYRERENVALRRLSPGRILIGGKRTPGHFHYVHRRVISDGRTTNNRLGSLVVGSGHCEYGRGR